MFNTFRYYHYSTFGLNFQHLQRKIKGVASIWLLLYEGWRFVQKPSKSFAVSFRLCCNRL